MIVNIWGAREAIGEWYKYRPMELRGDTKGGVTEEGFVQSLCGQAGRTWTRGAGTDIYILLTADIHSPPQQNFPSFCQRSCVTPVRTILSRSTRG